MNFSELKTELSDRGFTYLSDTRRGQYINRARRRLDSMYRWPYRQATSSGAAPLTISDLGQVDFVRNSSISSVPLCESNFDDLAGWYGDLTITGTPYYWYRTRTASSVSTYPVSTDTIFVNYWKTTPLLTGTDTPLSPTDFHLLYVDLAVQMAYRDNDNHAAAEGLQVEINRQVFEMLEELVPQHDFQYQRTNWQTSEDW